MHVRASLQATAPPCQNDRKIRVAMRIAITVRPTKDNHDVIEQGALTFLHRLELGEEVGKLVRVEPVDLLELLNFGAVVGVMR